MVKGLDTFRNYFADYEEQYVLIGGADLINLKMIPILK